MDFFNFKRTKTEVQVKKRQRQEYRLIGSMNHKSGHTLFSINTKTGEVKPAEFMTDDVITWEKAVNVYRGGSIPMKVLVEKDCVYIEALNKENAMKKYNKEYKA